MVEKTMRELADLSLQLNSESNNINATIVALNNKLQTLNIGLEVWLENSLIDALPGDERQDGVGPYLGYCSVEDQWQLAVRARPKSGSCFGAPVGSGAGWVGELPRVPLVKATREVRLAALPQLPFLVARLHQEAQRVLKAIQEARSLCTQSLTMNKNDILGTVLLGLAARFEEGNRHRSTFAPSTPEENKPLREILAELTAEGSITELAGTYQFSPEGYKKYRSQIEWIRTTGGL